ncbi:MAG: hypothetical protein R3F34_19700 [Planctomycetota bacterium]
MPDIYFEYTTWTLFGGGLLTAPFNLIHPYGSAHSEFVVPPLPVFAGLTVHHAYAARRPRARCAVVVRQYAVERALVP